MVVGVSVTGMTSTMCARYGFIEKPYLNGEPTGRSGAMVESIFDRIGTDRPRCELCQCEYRRKGHREQIGDYRCLAKRESGMIFSRYCGRAIAADQLQAWIVHHGQVAFDTKLLTLITQFKR